MASIKNDYGRWIKELRRKLELTQAQFAAMYHIPLQTLCNWEQNNRAPGTAATSYLIVIAKYPALVRDALIEARKSPER